MGHPGPRQRPRLLIVDDQEDVRALLKIALEVEGYDVVEARDARDGLRCLEQGRFDLVISDYAMPGGTGLWMLHEAARRGLLDGTPAFIATAHPDVREDSEFQILRKPLDLDRFLTQVRHVLQQHGALGDVRGDALGAGDADVELVLYVSASSFVSNQARRNLHETLQRFAGARVTLAVRDLATDPLAGEEDGISLTPTLVKRRPGPKIWIIGSLQDRELLADVLEGAGLAPLRDSH